MKTATIYAPHTVFTVAMSRENPMYGSGYEVSLSCKREGLWAMHIARTEDEAHKVFNTLVKQARTAGWAAE